MGELNLKPIDAKKFLHTRNRSYRGMSVNRHGYFLMTRVMQRELEVKNGDYISLAKHGKRWFITCSNSGTDNNFKVDGFKEENNLRLHVGKYLVNIICDDLGIKKRLGRIFMSVERIPSNGYFWFEMLKSDPYGLIPD